MAKEKSKVLKQENPRIDLGYSDTPNGELSLSVWKDGTTFLSLHNATDVKISRHFTKKVGWVNFIKCYTNGKWVNISLFEKEGEK